MNSYTLFDIYPV